MIPHPFKPVLTIEDLAPYAVAQTPAPGETGGTPPQGNGTSPNMTPGPGETTSTPVDEGGKPPSGGLSDFMLPAIIMFAVFYFVLIRPEKKNRLKRESMLGGLKKGDEVVTSSGMYASVIQIQDDIVTLQAAEGVRLRFSRAAVQTVVDPKGGRSDASGKASAPTEDSDLATADAR